MCSKEHEQTLVIGIGNPLRCDDGVGPFIASEIEKKNLPHVSVIVTPQLSVELLEDVHRFSRVFLIDASYTGEGLMFRKIGTTSNDKITSSHHLAPELFLSLLRSIYHKAPNFFLCSVRGRDFEFKEGFSEDMLVLAHKATEEICGLIRER